MATNEQNRNAGGAGGNWRVLSMMDTSVCPDALDGLARAVELVGAAPDQQRLEEMIGGFDAFLAALNVRVTADVLERAPRLRVIATPTTGLDHIDVAAAEARGVAILSLKNDVAWLESVTATAELTWGLLLAVVRHLPEAVAASRAGDWARDRFRGNQLSGKTLGIVGYGRLGRMVAEYGRAFRMPVLVCDVKPVRTTPGVPQTTFEEVLRRSDVVSVHIHLTPKNRHLFDASAIRSMKPGAILLNTSRRLIIDESAMLAALEVGHLGGVGLDVIDGEWDPALQNHPLIQYSNRRDNLIITPHIGGVTFESQSSSFVQTVRKLRDFVSHSSLPGSGFSSITNTHEYTEQQR